MISSTTSFMSLVGSAKAHAIRGELLSLCQTQPSQDTQRRTDQYCPCLVVNRYLNLEHSRDQTWPPLIPACATLLDILGIVGSNDVLTSLSVVHDGLCVREESIEAPVEDAGGDKRVDISDAETVKVNTVSVGSTSSSTGRGLTDADHPGRRR